MARKRGDTPLPPHSPYRDRPGWNLAGGVRAPEWFRLLHVAGDRALGVVTDELGVPTIVVVYEVVGW